MTVGGAARAGALAAIMNEVAKAKAAFRERFILRLP
jgi:hypothetical protein